MNRELISVIDEIGRQKGIDKTKVIGAIEAALQTAAKSDSGRPRIFKSRSMPKPARSQSSPRRSSSMQ